MKTQAEKLLKEHKDTLIEDFTEQYMSEYAGSCVYEDVVELIRDIDLDSTDFNIGFEKGYLLALETLLNYENIN